MTAAIETPEQATTRRAIHALRVLATRHDVEPVLADAALGALAHDSWWTAGAALDVGVSNRYAAIGRALREADDRDRAPAGRQHAQGVADEHLWRLTHPRHHRPCGECLKSGEVHLVRSVRSADWRVAPVSVADLAADGLCARCSLVRIEAAAVLRPGISA